MTKAHRKPWEPIPRTVDPLIALLALLCILLAGLQITQRSARSRPATDRAGLLGRIAELKEGLPALSRLPMPDPPAPKGTWTWDEGVQAVLAAEAASSSGAVPRAPRPGDPGFDGAWAAAYGEGAPVAPEARRRILTALGDGYAARRLEARWLARQGQDPSPVLARAEAWLRWRSGIFLGAAGAIAALALGGLVLGPFWVRRRPAVAPSHLPDLPSARASLVVFFGWFLAFLLSGSIAAAILSALPALRPLGLLLAYGLHAVAGLALVCTATGLGPRTLWRTLVPDHRPRRLLQALGFLAIAVAWVLASSLLLSPFLPSGEPPQRDLVEQLTREGSALAQVVNLAVLVLLAPAFEELLFRGFLLSALHRAFGALAALVVSGAAFGLIHLQPAGLPTLTVLGLVLGLARLRTGSLLPPILMHAAWNGGVFLLMWTLVG